jgi:hypothetical protein
MKIATSMLLVAVSAGALAASVCAPATTADAAPSASPYAGAYSGGIGYGGGSQGGGGESGSLKPYWKLDVTVSSAGKIAGVANYFEQGAYPGLYVSPPGDGSARGVLSTDGTIRLSVSDRARESVSTTFTVDADGVISAFDFRSPGIYVTLTPK